jgi:acyl-coenzyme A synthetase/AMP-(fatty) acid ligase
MILRPANANPHAQPLVEQATKISTFKPFKTIIWQRDQLRWDPVRKEDGQRNWQRLVKSARNRGLKADAVPVKGSDPLYIIYTSGTTGLPKGVVREAGGHAVGLNFSIRYLFDVHGPGDVMFTASDIGWVVGVSISLHCTNLKAVMSNTTQLWLPGQKAKQDKTDVESGAVMLTWNSTPTSSTRPSSPAPQPSSSKANPSARPTPRPSGASAPITP